MYGILYRYRFNMRRFLVEVHSAKQFSTLFSKTNEIGRRNKRRFCIHKHHLQCQLRCALLVPTTSYRKSLLRELAESWRHLRGTEGVLYEMAAVIQSACNWVGCDDAGLIHVVDSEGSISQTQCCSWRRWQPCSQPSTVQLRFWIFSRKLRLKETNATINTRTCLPLFTLTFVERQDDKKH